MQGEPYGNQDRRTTRCGKPPEQPYWPKSLNEARKLGVKTAFLYLHSHHDVILAKGLVQLLSDAGWRVYIDWQDTQMQKANQETAQRIEAKDRRSGVLSILGNPELNVVALVPLGNQLCGRE